MNKNKWIKPLIGLTCSLVFAIYLATVEYDEYIRHPENSSSPTGSGRLFNLLFYQIDKSIGKVGVFILLGIISLFFLYKFIQALKRKY